MSNLRLPKGLFQKGNKIWFSAYNSKLGKTEKKTTRLDAQRINIHQAKQIRENYLDSINSIKLIPKTKVIKLTEALNYFKKTLRFTHSNYDSAVKMLISAIGEKYISDYRIEDADAFVVYMRDERKLSTNTIASYTKAIKTLFVFLQKRKYLQEVVFEKEKSVKKKPKGVPISEIEKMFDKLQNEWKYIDGYRFLKTLLNTGLRTSEAINLKWDDIDFDNQILAINNGKHRDDVDYMPITDEALEHFLSFRDEAKKQNQSKRTFIYVHPFTNRSPKFYKRLNKELYGENRYTFHQFRTTFITSLVHVLEPYDVMEYSRHKKFQTVLDHYTQKMLFRIVAKSRKKIRRFDL